MQRLAEIKEKEIGRGAVFRVKAEYPYEAVVDFMLVETTDAERPLGVMVATGYSAGHTFVHLPHEALMKGTRMLSTAWLKQNWEKWVYPPCPPQEVIFLEHYPEPARSGAMSLLYPA